MIKVAINLTNEQLSGTTNTWRQCLRRRKRRQQKLHRRIGASANVRRVDVHVVTLSGAKVIEFEGRIGGGEIANQIETRLVHDVLGRRREHMLDAVELGEHFEELEKEVLLEASVIARRAHHFRGSLLYETNETI